MAARPVTVNLKYRATVGYVVASTVNTLVLKPGDVLQQADCQALIRDGFTVKVSG